MENFSLYSVTANAKSKEKNLERRGKMFKKYYIPYLKDVGIFQSGKNCIELGCGQGHKLQILQDSFPNTSFAGLEKSTEMISKAKEKLPNTQLLQGDILNLQDIGKETYDTVCLFQVIHHFSQQNRMNVCIEVERILKPQGHVIVIDSFRPESGNIRQYIWDNINTFYAILSQYPAESLVQRVKIATQNIIFSDYDAKDFGYFSPTQSTVFGKEKGNLTLISNITPKVLSCVPCISDIMIFKKI